MSDHYYPSPYPCDQRAPFSPATVAVLQSAAMGATVGAAAATLVGQSLGCSKTLTRFAAMFVTSATLMYLLNPSKQGESQ